jgi:hypothetical protein
MYKNIITVLIIVCIVLLICNIKNNNLEHFNPSWVPDHYEFS